MESPDIKDSELPVLARINRNLPARISTVSITIGSLLAADSREL